MYFVPKLRVVPLRLRKESLLQIEIKKLKEDAIIPKYQTAGAAGFDIHSLTEGVIRASGMLIVDTGLAFAIPEGYELQIRPRSGLAFKNCITIVNSPGTLDSDFRGELKVALFNLASEPFKVAKGDRIAQCVVNKIEQADITVVEELSDTDRGTDGFGSTGNR